MKRCIQKHTFYILHKINVLNVVRNTSKEKRIIVLNVVGITFEARLKRNAL